MRVAVNALASLLLAAICAVAAVRFCSAATQPAGDWLDVAGAAVAVVFATGFAWLAIPKPKEPTA